MRQTMALVAPIEPALAALKDWLAIAGVGEDDVLGGCLEAAIALCERFTGLAPLASQITERLPAQGAWTRAATAPAREVSAVTAIGMRLAMRPLDLAEVEWRVDADGMLELRVPQPIAEPWLEVAFSAGLAESWEELAPDLRHGILRFAAHQYRERDGGAKVELPAAVAALWRPYRRLRL